MNKKKATMIILAMRKSRFIGVIGLADRMQGGILTPTEIGAKGHWPHYFEVVYFSHDRADSNESHSQVPPPTWDHASHGLQF
jgi:hypothetical protein